MTPLHALGPITNKLQGLVLLQAGRLGNTLRFWRTYEQVLASGYRGTLTMRYSAHYGGAFCTYNVPVAQVPQVLQEWQSRGADITLAIYNESAPDGCLILQGEVLQDHNGLVLYYSTEPCKMRDALRTSGRQIQGLRAKMTLEHHLDPDSYADLLALLEAFPEHVVEFSTYATDLGWCPHHNTVIWEVRAY